MRSCTTSHVQSWWYVQEGQTLHSVQGWFLWCAPQRRRIEVGREQFQLSKEPAPSFGRVSRSISCQESIVLLWEMLADCLASTDMMV